MMTWLTKRDKVTVIQLFHVTLLNGEINSCSCFAVMVLLKSNKG